MQFPERGRLGNRVPFRAEILGHSFPARSHGESLTQNLLRLWDALSEGMFLRNFEEWLYAALQWRKSATLVQHASVAQGIEHRSPKAGVDGSNPPGGTREYDGVARAAPFLVCGGRRRIRTVDTRVTNFPAGGVFESAGGTRDLPIPVPQRRYALLVLESSSSVP